MTDECYCHFLYDSEPFSIASLPGAKETVVVAGSLSKTYAMTGWRIGFALAPAPIIERHDEAAKPYHVESDVHCAEGGGGSAARPAGFGGCDAGRIPPPARFRDGAAARHSGRRMCRAARARFTPIPTLAWRLTRRHHDDAAILRRDCSRKRTWRWFRARRSAPQHIRISYATSMADLEKGLQPCAQLVVKNWSGRNQK